MLINFFKIARYIITTALIVHAAHITASDFGASEQSGLDKLDKISGKTVGKKTKSYSKASSDYYLGLELSSSELLSFNIHNTRGPFTLKYSLTPPLPIDITVNMPKDLISTSNNVRFDHPAYTIDFELTWGPAASFEAYYFPANLPLYASLGVGARKIRLKGSTSSSILISNLDDPETSYETSTVFGASLDTESTSFLFKVKAGGAFKLGKFLIDIGFGLVRPKNISRSVSGSVSVDAPGNSDLSLPAEDLASLKNEKSKEMEEQMLEELTKIDEVTLPLVSFALAYQF